HRHIMTHYDRIACFLYFDSCASHEILVVLIRPFTVFLGCGERPVMGPPSGSRVVGGHFAVKGAWPWQVSIQWMSSHICGGSILNHLWILSAAHCFNKSYSTLQVVAGLHSLSKIGSTAQIRSVERIIKHEDYDETSFENDIALLQLQHPLFFTTHVQPVCTLRNEREERDLSFSSCFVSGWGSTVFKGSLVDTLREAEVELIDTETCNQQDWHSGHVSDNMVCAGRERGGTDTCQVMFVTHTLKYNINKNTILIKLIKQLFNTFCDKNVYLNYYSLLLNNNCFFFFTKTVVPKISVNEPQAYVLLCDS
uniref:Peptidase S1 domain-containing protein n=1 Tax=Pygocentrus nattereri TaxID=42514 RepID=A0A3B4D6R8_PYGNA